MIFKPKDLIDVFILLKTSGIKNFDESIPSFMLELIYGFIWEIIYKAKIISSHRKKKNISLIDLEIACIIISNDLIKIDRKFNNLCLGNNIINSTNLPKKKKENFFELPQEYFLLTENNILHKFK